MAATTSKTLHLIKAIPEGIPEEEHFKIVESELPSLEDGGITLQVLVMSPDPFLRGRMKTEANVGPVSGFLAGKVVESKSDKWVAGDLLGAMLPFSTPQVVSAKHMAATVMWKLSDVIDESQISLGVGILGMPGATSYGGVTGVLQPKEGETIFVSGAAGAVGGVVGQIAKNIYKCRVVGSCGGPQKGELIKNKYGFDASVDYKQASDAEELGKLLKEVAPEGINMYFENVGGMHFEVAMKNLLPYGRVAVCGVISSYNEKEIQPVPLNLGGLIYTQQRIEGFLSTPWLTGQKGNFHKEMAQWYKEGKIVVEETTFNGFDQWVTGFRSLFTGGNTGKVVIRI
eukprot:CAMPEP_0201489630 /NCGR_PEP_ID=MMETSP0151_2-20130828/23077_1 /ASSEMBLY_ACC=CAM_ASM_000257 /TAXON_ID=200890 /ORGANISM="Paramoeba atlantica, Strain 621/1 / CCAP 1560/9" /LENGTH=341 /DNA_ID=CAMNT_0047875283 /DNA_START=137 /DNA_END=1162 /DNA_ORIENTATION=-